VHHVFKDHGISGSRADREGIIAMLAYLKKNKNKRHVVIVDDISRLARDIRVHLDLRDAIDSCGAILESPAMTFGVDADGRYFENMQALSAMHHREKNAEQTKKRQQARVIDGYWPFPATLGYRHERKSGQGKVMTPQEPLASILREALEGYACGLFQTQAEVARFLGSQPEFPHKTQFGTVTIEAVSRILNRVHYAGYVEKKEWNIPLRLHGKPKIAVRADIDGDFPLRGFVRCNDCGYPLTSCWSKSKTGAKHPYYYCYRQGCESRGKSVRRAELEGQFETMLSEMKPSRMLFDVAQSMFKQAWSILHENESARQQSIKAALREAEKKIENLLDRIVEANSASVIVAYEKRIDTLEREKLVLQEQLENTTKNRRPFAEMFELAMQFLANPQKLWQNGQLAHKRTVLKLAFADQLKYCQKTGLQTPKLSKIFRMIQEINPLNSQMAEEVRFELTEKLPPRRFSRPVP
jgi:site-specific DNA recombinase